MATTLQRLKQAVRSSTRFGGRGRGLQWVRTGPQCNWQCGCTHARNHLLAVLPLGLLGTCRLCLSISTRACYMEARTWGKIRLCISAHIELQARNPSLDTVSIRIMIVNHKITYWVQEWWNAFIFCNCNKVSLNICPSCLNLGTGRCRRKRTAVLHHLSRHHTGYQGMGWYESTWGYGGLRWKRLQSRWKVRRYPHPESKIAYALWYTHCHCWLWPWMCRCHGMVYIILFQQSSKVLS